MGFFSAQRQTEEEQRLWEIYLKKSTDRIKVAPQSEDVKADLCPIISEFCSSATCRGCLIYNSEKKRVKEEKERAAREDNEARQARAKKSTLSDRQARQERERIRRKLSERKRVRDEIYGKKGD